jgi:hypothetical protein
MTVRGMTYLAVLAALLAGDAGAGTVLRGRRVEAASGGVAYWTDTNSANLQYYYPMVYTQGAMVATYPLDSGTTPYGDWARVMPTASTGPTWYNGAFTNALGRTGSYFQFDGSDDYANLAYTNIWKSYGSNYTFMCWITGTDGTGFDFLFYSFTPRFVIAWETDIANRMGYYDESGSWKYTITNTVLQTGWHHLAITLKSTGITTNIKWYVDGNLMWYGAWQVAALIGDSDTNTAIGAKVDGSFPSPLSIESFWWYTNACSQEYIQEHMTNTSPVSVNGDLYPRP